MFTPRQVLLRRNFHTLSNRIPHKRIVESAARHGHDRIIIQHVRMQRPFFSKSRLVGTVAVSAAIYGLGRFLGVEVKVEEEEQKTTRSSTGQDDGWQTVGQGVEDEEEEDSAILFLPTGFSRPRPRTFYRGSDPEWQAFQEVSQDRPRIEKIRAEFIAAIRNPLASQPAVVARIGNVDKSKGKAWVEFKFPDGPPTEYERPGIELTEDLEWRRATRPVEEAHHKRLNKAFAPTAVAKAVYQDTTRRAGNSWKDFKAYMGWDEESQTETVQQLVQRIGANPRSSLNPSVPSPTNSSAPTSAKDTQQPATSPAPADGPDKDVGFVLPDPKRMMLDLSEFRADFRKEYAKEHKQTPMSVPRGTFVVMGLVELYGDRGRMTITVAAAYDPKAARFIEFRTHIYSITMFRQPPRGGP